MQNEKQLEEAGLEDFIRTNLPRFIEIPNRYTDELIGLNLFLLFSQNETSALRFVEFIESHFQVSIADWEVDYFFFSDIETMKQVIQRNNDVQKSSV
jgi:hypothetical protein